jgi:hemerythrin
MMIRRVRPLIGPPHLLGHDMIDADHLAIADWWLRTVNCEPIQFEFYQARLKRLMRQHFDHEAMLMEEAGGRMCKCHDLEHQMMLALCERVSALGRSRWQKAQSLLRTELPRLVREHIISMDQLTVLFINSQDKLVRAC